MGLFDFIGAIFAPATKLIDDLNTSDEERLQLRNELAKIEGQALSKLTELEKSRLEAMSKVQVAEAGSKHFITATWRPISSLLMVSVIVLASFGVIPSPNESFYSLATLFLGAYSGGRSLEKFGSLIKLGRK
jgi:Holin of 3TMs, for gene-transfer release